MTKPEVSLDTRHHPIEGFRFPISLGILGFPGFTLLTSGYVLLGYVISLVGAIITCCLYAPEISAFLRHRRFNHNLIICVAFSSAEILLSTYIALDKSAKKSDASQITTAAASRNPREELAREGVTWVRDNFDQAINERDGHDIQLFINGGMRIGRNELSSLANSSFDQTTAEILAKHRDSLDPDACPTDGPNWEFYQPGINNTAKANFLREMCATSSNLSQIHRTISAENVKIDAIRLGNSKIALSVNNCIRSLRSYGYSRLQDEATNVQRLMSLLVFTPRDRVEFEIMQKYIVDRSDQVDVDAIVRKTCVDANAPQSEDRSALNGWVAALRLMSS